MGNAFVRIDMNFDGLSDNLFLNLGGGGGGAVACGYGIAAAMKYSNNEATRSMYEGIIDIIYADEIDDIIDAWDQIKQAGIMRYGRPVVKMANGIRQTVVGAGLLMAPVPTPADDIVGVRKIQIGVFQFFYGLTLLISEVCE